MGRYRNFTGHLTQTGSVRPSQGRSREFESRSVHQFFTIQHLKSVQISLSTKGPEVLSTNGVVVFPDLRGVVPGAFGLFECLKVPASAIEFLGRSGGAVPHQDAYRLYVQIGIDVLLTERSATGPELEFNVKILLDDVLDLPDPVDAEIAVRAPFRGKKSW